MPLKILYSFPQRIGVAGIGMIAWHQVVGLLAQGMQVELFCGSCERPVPGLEQVTETMKLAGLRIPYRLIGGDNAMAWHDRTVARYLTRTKNPPDLVHCWPLGAIHTLKAAKRRGIPTVLERPNSHTGFAYEAVAAEHKKIGLPLLPSNTHAYNARRLEREEAEYALATRLACPSDFVMNSFLHRGFAPRQIVRHRYGYDDTVFISVPLNGSPADKPRPFTAAFVGRCEPRKGLHYALEAWHASGAAAAGGKFLIAGAFVPGYRELLAKLLDHPSVEVLGFLPNPNEVMQRSDVFLLPSIEEGSALVTYEARACGCVLAVSDATGAHCEHGREGLVHPAGDVTALTEHLRQLSTSPELLARLRAESLRSIPSLSWRAAAVQLASAYDEVLAAHPASQ